MQTAFYGLMVKEIVEENGLKTNNIYTVLNKNSFDRHFFVPGSNTKEHHNIGVFRPQKYSPITKFSQNDDFLDYVIEEGEAAAIWYTLALASEPVGEVFKTACHLFDRCLSLKNYFVVSPDFH